MFLTVNITLNEDGNLPSKSINYSNTRKHVIDLKTKSEREFDPDNVIHSTEVLAVHGQLSKAEKHHYTQIFLNLSHPDDGNICVLVATRDVGNVGIDSPDIRNVLQMHFPPSALDFVQEICQASLVHPLVPETYSYVLYYSIENYSIYLSIRVIPMRHI